MIQYDWPNRRMETYKQHLKLNCGATAALFAVYGLREQVPDSAISTLLKEGMLAPAICDFVNTTSLATKATAKYYGMRVKLGNGQMTNIEYLEKLSSPLDGIEDILDTNKLRCLIVSGDTNAGLHWQTFFKSSVKGNVRIYNGRASWRPMLIPRGMAPTAAILVTGPPIM